MRSILRTSFVFVLIEIFTYHRTVNGAFPTPFGAAAGNRLLETQLQNVAREQQKIGGRLLNAAIQEIHININKLPIVNHFQTTIVNSLANKGLSDLNNIGRTITDQSLRQCFDQNGFTFTAAINIAKTNSLQCISDKFNEISGIVENGKVNITNALTNVQDVAQLLAQCTQLTNTYPTLAGTIAKGACLNAAILSIQTDTILLPINIAKRALEVRDSINSIQADMAKCGLKILQTISEQSIAAAKAITKCISEQASGSNING